MGQKEEEVKRLRVVLDTNVIVSALLFTGKASQLVDKWKSGSIVLLATKDIVLEYLRVLAYPKFKLTETEIEVLLNQEILPYIETIKTKGNFHLNSSKDPSSSMIPSSMMKTVYR